MPVPYLACVQNSGGEALIVCNPMNSQLFFGVSKASEEELRYVMVPDRLVQSHTSMAQERQTALQTDLVLIVPTSGSKLVKTSHVSTIKN